MRKRLTAWLLALVMALTLVGCRDDVTVIGVTTGGDQTPQQQEQQDVLPDEGDETPDVPDNDGADAAIDEDGSYTSKEDVALYIHTYGHLPGNFITKKEAQALGWSGGSLEPYAPGKCIGGIVCLLRISCSVAHRAGFCRRRRVAPTPSAISTRWAPAAGAPSGSCSLTTD